MAKRINRFLITLLSGAFLTLAGCIDHQPEEKEESLEVQQQMELEVKYAQGFTLDYKEGYIRITTRSISDNQDFQDSLFVVNDPTLQLPEGIKRINSSNIRLACQSSTYLAFLRVLDGLNNVCGLCGMQYVQNDEVKHVLKENEVSEICLGEGVLGEALYGADPDLFLVYPFGREKNEGFNERGIHTLLIAEYLEESQLARLEWVKLFGVLLGKAEIANAYFEKVESEYRELRQNAQDLNHRFIMNLPFQENWFMPSANSVGVELIEDAGLTYFYKDEEGTENILHSKETVWNDGTESDYWIIIARREIGFDLEDLLSEEPVYKEFKAVKNKQVIFCNTAEVDYFAQGVVEPEIILKDLLYATGQIEDYSPRYFFLLN